MEYTNFGKTGMRVSVAGLGCGGGSRLGKARGASKAESVALVRTAMDLGVNYLDTAHNYTTEDIVGEAIKAVPRDQIYVGTKSIIRRDGKMLLREGDCQPAWTTHCANSAPTTSTCSSFMR